MSHGNVWLLLASLFLATAPAAGQGFKFSEDDRADKAAEAAKRERIASHLSVPCRESLKNRKIMVIIGEQQGNGRVLAQQQNYGPHFQAINSRLRALGLATYTPDEIRKQIAQAEIDAYFKNDPDAALAASKRLGASFVLRGLITTDTAVNPILRLNEVRVGMGFTLAGANGKVVSDAAARAASYAGGDTRGMALTLLEEQADEVVSKLYADYCGNGAGSPAVQRKRQ